LKAGREKNQIAYKCKHNKITADFSTETLKAKRAWNEVFQAWKEKKFSLRILYQQNYHSKMKEEKILP
jgi:hypothetical protein